ncbi:manganese efflux pump MntP family protein [Peribacillus acanthi]|uniref:manganese efflux pump MntP n=1 Tax=Peribacillus acanthi TaxID=2171554 RepID=UPI000D3E0771|nr:manganese efflux pump MntP family protein [Peribacillus acanthi]
MNTVVGEVLTLLIMAFALSMDAFSIGLGMGMYQLRLKRIFFIGLTVGFFHIWMPLLGMATGRFLSDQFGMFASYAGGILLIIMGIQMFITGFKEEEETILAPVGIGLVLFAISVSLDSFSVGLTLGIYGARTLVTVLFFGLAATFLTWAGLILGKKVQGFVGKYSEFVGGSILIAFGIKLLLPL